MSSLIWHKQILKKIMHKGIFLYPKIDGFGTERVKN